MGDVVTSVLELLGALLLVAAAGWFVAAWSAPAGLAVVGAGLLAVAWLLDAVPAWLARREGATR